MITINKLRDCCGDHPISKDIWQRRSLDLTPPNSLCGGNFKERHYKDNLRVLNDLKKSMSQALSDITPATLGRSSMWRHTGIRLEL
jgi:hypothetical protein